MPQSWGRVLAASCIPAEYSTLHISSVCRKNKTMPEKCTGHCSGQHSHNYRRMYVVGGLENSPKSFFSQLFRRIQNTQEIKRTLFNWMQQDKTCKFLRKSSFSSYKRHKNRKANNEFNLSCVSWLWEAGRRKRAQN